MIGGFNYLAIPKNAPNKAAALVLANLILEPELQAAQILPENGFGLGYAIDVTRVNDAAQRAALDAAQTRLGAAATPAEDLANALVGDSAGEYQTLVEEGWRQQVLLVTHARGEALAMADRVALLDRSALLACGAPRPLFKRPPTTRTARLMGVTCSSTAPGWARTVQLRPRRLPKLALCSPSTCAPQSRSPTPCCRRSRACRAG